MDSAVFELTVIVTVAVMATWAAARLKIPSIVLLLSGGVIVGPVLRIVDPDALAGDLLLPAVSISVGLILFEGGLSLHLRELEQNQRVVWLLVSVGVAVTWVLGSLAAVTFLGLPREIAILVGAILVVSGPTVIAPILTSVRPNRDVSSVLKWESIVIDPIGAMLAVVAFELIFLGAEGPAGEILGQVVVFILGGIAVGLVIAVPTGFALQRHLVPERLIPLVGLTAAVIAFGISDAIAKESGLLATSVLGLVLGNARRVRTETIIQFSEVIQTLLVGVLFIVLSARLTTEQLSEISVGVIGLVAVLVLVARPIGVAISTIGSSFSVREKLFLAGVAPRGIVAAAVASVFALELEEAGLEGAELLTPVTFAVIVATVLIYGFGAGPLARRLGLAGKSNEGVLILGAGVVEREIGAALAESGIKVIFASTNRRDERRARMAGHATYYGNLIEHELPWELDLAGIGRLAALTANDEVNTLACRRFREVFGAADCYQLAAAPIGPGIEGSVADIGGRVLFGPDMTHATLRKHFTAGGTIRKTSLTDEFTANNLPAGLADGRALFLVRGSSLLVGTIDASRPLIERAQPGDLVLWIETRAERQEAERDDQEPAAAS